MNKYKYIPDSPCFCIRLRRIAQKVTDFYDKIIKPSGVSANQFFLLVNLNFTEGCGIGELAQRVKLEKSTLARTLRPLLLSGLVVDKSSEKSRKRQLHVSSLGKDTLEKALPLWKKAQEEMTIRLEMGHDDFMDIFKQIDLLD